MQITDAVTAIRAYRSALTTQSMKLHDTFRQVLQRTDVVLEALEGLRQGALDAGGHDGVAHVEYHVQGVLNDARKVLKLLHHHVPAHYAAAAAHVAAVAVGQSASPSTVKLGHALLTAHAAATSAASLASSPASPQALLTGGADPSTSQAPQPQRRQWHFALFLAAEDEAARATTTTENGCEADAQQRRSRSIKALEVERRQQRDIAIGVTTLLNAPLLLLPHSDALDALLRTVSSVDAPVLLDPVATRRCVAQCMEIVSRCAIGQTCTPSSGVVVVLILPSSAFELAATFREACLALRHAAPSSSTSGGCLYGQQSVHVATAQRHSEVDVAVRRIAALPPLTQQWMMQLANMCLFVSTDRLASRLQPHRAVALMHPLGESAPQQPVQGGDGGSQHAVAPDRPCGVAQQQQLSSTHTSMGMMASQDNHSDDGASLADPWDDDDLMQMLGFIERRHHNAGDGAGGCNVATNGSPSAARAAVKRARDIDDASAEEVQTPHGGVDAAERAIPPPAAATSPVLLRRWRSRSATALVPNTAAAAGATVESQLVQFDPLASDDDDDPSFEIAGRCASPDAAIECHDVNGAFGPSGGDIATMRDAVTGDVDVSGLGPLEGCDDGALPIIFQLTNSVRDRRRELHQRIGALGSASVDNASHYTPSAHVLIVADGVMERTEKYLAFCAAGKSIVSPRYVTDSAAHGGWLPLQSSRLHGKRCAALEYELSPIRRRMLLAPMASPPGAGVGVGLRQQPPRPFVSWKVVLFASRQVAKGITAILAAGGCSVCIADPEPPEQSQWAPLSADDCDGCEKPLPSWIVPADMAGDGTTVASLTAFLRDDARVTHVLVEGPLVGDAFVPPAALPRCVVQDADVATRKLFTLELLHHVLCVAVGNPFSPVTGLLAPCDGHDSSGSNILPPTCRLEF